VLMIAYFNNSVCEWTAYKYICILMRSRWNEGQQGINEMALAEHLLFMCSWRKLILKRDRTNTDTATQSVSFPSFFLSSPRVNISEINDTSGGAVVCGMFFFFFLVLHDILKMLIHSGMKQVTDFINESLNNSLYFFSFCF